MSSKVFKTLKISVKIFLLLNFLHVFNTKLNVSRPRNDLAYDKLFKNINIKSDSKASKLKMPTECLNDHLTLKPVENESREHQLTKNVQAENEFMSLIQLFFL